MESSRQQAVKSIAESGDDEDDHRPEIVSVDQVDHDEGNEDHPKQRELVGRSEDLRELHVRSLEVRDGVFSGA